MLTHKGTKDIKTKRLLLREINPDDYKDMYSYVIKEEVAEYVSWTPHKSKDCKAEIDGKPLSFYRLKKSDSEK